MKIIMYIGILTNNRIKELETTLKHINMGMKIILTTKTKNFIKQAEYEFKRK